MTMVAKSVTRLIADVAKAERESRTLAALCDALLPKLISGELQVRSGLCAERGTPVRHGAAGMDQGEDHR